MLWWNDRGSICPSAYAEKNSGLHAARSRGMDNYHMLEEVIKPAELSHNPRSLQALWREYKEGLNGRKPAEQWSTDEVNVNKAVATMYGRRRQVWTTIQRMVNSGRSAEYAILRIHQVYGSKSSPTQIMEFIRQDKTRYPGGFHPDLQ